MARTSDRSARMLRSTVSIDAEDQADIDKLHEVQNLLEQSIELANLHDDPLRFPLRAVSELAEIQLQTQIKTRQILRHALRAADRVSSPTDILKEQIAKSFRVLAWEQRLRFSAVVAMLFASAATIVGVIVAGAVIESHSNTPEAQALLTASGKFPAGWATLIRQNDLQFMRRMCDESPNPGTLPNGMHYCSIPLIMDGVQAKPPLPAWSQDAASGAPP